MIDRELLARWRATKPSIRRDPKYPTLPWKIRVPGHEFYVRSFVEALARLDRWYRYDE